MAPTIQGHVYQLSYWRETFTFSGLNHFNASNKAFLKKNYRPFEAPDQDPKVGPKPSQSL